LQSKSEKYIFVGYSEDVKGYRLIQPHYNEIIFRRDVKFDENLLSSEPNLMIVYSSAYEPSSTFFFFYEPSSVFVPYSIHILVSSSDDDNEDENPPPPTHLPPMSPLNLNENQIHRSLDGSIQHEK
jgi:hypothetical protein